MQHRALLTHRDCLPARVDIIDIEMSYSRPPHPGFNERVDNRAVPVRSIPFPLRPLPFPSMPTSIFRLSPNPQEQVRGVKHLSPPLRGERSINLKRVSYRDALNLRHRFAERKREELLDPLRERLQMSNDAIDCFVREPPPPCSLTSFLKVSTNARESRGDQARRESLPVSISMTDKNSSRSLRWTRCELAAVVTSKAKNCSTHQRSESARSSGTRTSSPGRPSRDREFFPETFCGSGRGKFLDIGASLSDRILQERNVSCNVLFEAVFSFSGCSKSKLSPLNMFSAF